jgi:hypothetical protein
MSKWLMRGHFQHLHFNSFSMTWRMLQGKVFWPCNRTLKFWESPMTPKSPFWECECHPHTLPKVGLQHCFPINQTSLSTQCTLITKWSCHGLIFKRHVTHLVTFLVYSCTYLLWHIDSKFMAQIQFIASF